MTALKVLGSTVLVIAVGIAIAMAILYESEPEGRPGAEADRLAEQMMEAMNVAAWDTTRYLQWTFVNNNRYLWDRKLNHVLIVSSNDSVILDANSATGSSFHRDGTEMTGDIGDDAVASAWRNFCNDGFWLYAPFKVFDPGAVRSIVMLEDGSQALKVTYMEGGVTPGDSYLWILDEQLRPTSWKMWVSIFPIGGIEFSWEGWQRLPSGAWLSTAHRSALFDLQITDVNSGQTLEELGILSDPFQL